MTDSQYKSKTLLGLSQQYPAIGPLAPLTMARWSPFAGVARAQDAALAGGPRVVAMWSNGGATDWAQPNGTLNPADADGDGNQDANNSYPDADVWRRVGTYRANVTPGSELRARVLFCPSGLVQKVADDPNMPGAGYTNAGAWAKVRVGAAWKETPGGATTAYFYRECTLPGSTLGTYGGLEASAGGANWNALGIRDIVDIRPPTVMQDPSVAVWWSEWTRAEIRLEFKGGARVLAVCIYEHPLAHVQLHSNGDLKSAHAMPASTAPQTPMPMDDPPDGATYQEHRFGTDQLRDVAERQSERLGPRILHASSWRESDASIWDQSEQNPWAITGTGAFVDLHGLGFGAWNLEAPGWIVAASYARLHRLCEPRQIMAGGVAAVTPVRVSVDASRSGLGTGTLRAQSGPYEWVDVTVNGGRAWYTATGFLLSQVYGDQHVAVLQLFGKATVGTTLNVYNVSVDFGEWPL